MPPVARARYAAAARATWWLGLALLSACGSRSPSVEGPSPSRAALERKRNRERVRELRVVEAQLRRELDPLAAAPWVDVSGSDPYRLRPRPGGGFVGLLRGSRALVTLDAELRELGRVRLDESPTALCLSHSHAYVGSRWARTITKIQLSGLLATAGVDAGVDGVADLACGDEGVLHVLGASGELVTLGADARPLDRRASLAGGLRLAREGRYLFELSLFERTLRVWALSARGVPERELGRIAHDGPLWAVDGLEHEGELLIALSGAENEPLVRVHGEFENIDSFIWLYRLGAAAPRQVASLNVGELGLIVPKSLEVSGVGATLEVAAVAAGSGKVLRARWSSGLETPPQTRVEPCPPGASDAVFEADRISYASPLFDAWVRLEPSGITLRRVDQETRPSPEIRLGEALFTTDLIAPANRSQGAHSRFSCETCHFEGEVDGRIHYTGRADVSVVTKPLLGLANNRPHFSRARDPDLSSVSHNEFRVAGAGSAEDPWFSLPAADFPWLHELGIERAVLTPLELRAALVRFLYAFSHAPNVNALGRFRLDALEIAGASAFASKCAGCHAARTFSDDPDSQQPLHTWEALVLRRNAPLVWARGDYAKTGVLPYVDAQGTRIPSLRRLTLKPRYFTNGSAPRLTDVLERFRDAPGGAMHDAKMPTPGALPLEERQALLAFLRLL